MKNFLAGVCLFSISITALAESETRLLAIQRFGNPVQWKESDEHLPGISPYAPKGGSLITSPLQALESIHPYDLEQSVQRIRPSVLLDDLVFETLMLRDPLTRSGILYPLLAKAIRIPEDIGYVIFELDSRARFQDGSPVTGEDVLFSIDIFKQTGSDAAAAYQKAVRSVSVVGSEVRFDLNTTGQESRDAIFTIAKIKIVKPNTTASPSVAGIPVRFTSTGPYRLTFLGKNRLSLVIDPLYWGEKLGTRAGFFNFRIIESIGQQGDSVNFFEAQGRNTQRTNPEMETVEEEGLRPGDSLRSYVFNVARPQVADPRVRQALMLAYDFESINRVFHGGALVRPSSLLEKSEFAPKGKPADAVSSFMEACQVKEPNLPFEMTGHNSYLMYGEKRARLLNAMRLLQEAGLRLENGAFKRQTENGTWVPMRISILARPGDARDLAIYKDDLAHLGIEAKIVNPPSIQAFKVYNRSEEFDLIASEEKFLNADGLPYPGELDLNEPPRREACMKAITESMKETSPHSEKYILLAETIARLHQALYLNIFTGQLAKRTFYKDERLQVPAKMEMGKIHLYGYWAPENSANVPIPFYLNLPGHFSHCADLACLFGH